MSRLISVVAFVAAIFASVTASLADGKQTGISTGKVVFSDVSQTHDVFIQAPAGATLSISGAPGWLQVQPVRLEGDPTWNNKITLSIDPKAEVRSTQVELTIRYSSSTEAFHTVSVSRTDVKGADEFKVEREKVHFDSKTSMQIIGFSAPATVTSNADWCKVTVVDQGAEKFLRIEVAEYTGRDPRSTVINFSPVGSWAIHRVDVTQDPGDLNVQTAEHTVSREASVYTTVIPGDFKCSLSSSDSWMLPTWDAARNTLTVRIEANTVGYDRIGTITVDMGYGRVKEIKIAQSRYTVGDLYNEKGIRGIVFEMNGTHGKIVSLTEARNVQWCTGNIFIHATNQSDGWANMAAVRKMPDWKTDFPIFGWCDGLLGGEWYIPSIEEQKLIYANLTAINQTLSTIQGASIISLRYSDHVKMEQPGKKVKNHEDFTIRYWTSTEADDKNAYSRFGGDQNYQSKPKQQTNYARAIRKF